jgi:hypothetical protein
METSAERLLLTQVEGLIGRQHLASSIATCVCVLLAFGHHRKKDVPHAPQPEMARCNCPADRGLDREFYGNVKTRTFAEVLIDAAEDPYLRAVLVGMLREGRQGSSR